MSRSIFPANRARQRPEQLILPIARIPYVIIYGHADGTKCYTHHFQVNKYSNINIGSYTFFYASTCF